MPTYTVRVEYPVIAYATVQVEAAGAREAADKAAQMSRAGELTFDLDHETLGDQDSFYVAEGEVDVPSEDDGAVAFLSEHAKARQVPAVLVDVHGGTVAYVTACGEVRVMVLDRDNPSFNEDAVDDRVDAAMMERLARCGRELIEAHERGLEP